MSSTFPCSLGSFESDDYGINYNSFGVRNTIIAQSILQSEKTFGAGNNWVVIKVKVQGF